MESVTIKIKDIINTTYCVDASDGEKIFVLLKKTLGEKKNVILSFDGIELVITAFLNTAVGKLFGDFDEHFILLHLSTSNMTDDFQPVWDKVIDGAPKYYANKEAFDKNISEIIEE